MVSLKSMTSSPQTLNWSLLIKYGVPLSIQNLEETIPNMDLLRVELQKIPAPTELDERSREALQAWVLALRDHFPTCYQKLLQKSSTLQAFEKLPTSGRTVKLRRIAIARLAQVL